MLQKERTIIKIQIMKRVKAMMEGKSFDVYVFSESSISFPTKSAYENIAPKNPPANIFKKSKFGIDFTIITNIIIAKKI